MQRSLGGISRQLHHSGCGKELFSFKIFSALRAFLDCRKLRNPRRIVPENTTAEMIPFHVSTLFGGSILVSLVEPEARP